jgi:hypothetical protein
VNTERGNVAGMVTLDDLSDPAPDPSPDDWNDNGIVYLPSFVPGPLIDAYRDEWAARNGYRGRHSAMPPDDGDGQWSSTGIGDPWALEVLDAERPGGWNEACPYMHEPALRAICTYPPLAQVLGDLIGQPAGLHLNLTGWVSTLRDWHQDTYLNPYEVGDQYAAVWIALGDVHPDSGVFQYVPGSHRWHRLTRDKIASVVNVGDPSWPEHTEAVLTRLVEAELDRRGAEVVSYCPNRGDVLIWHSRLYHRGSRPTVPGAYRPAVIAHYSGVRVRPDMPAPVQAPDTDEGSGGWYFPIWTDQAVQSDMRSREVTA